jgi:hypothetical protein
MLSIQDFLFITMALAAAILGGYILYGRYIAPWIGKTVPQEVLSRARELALEVVCYIEQILPGESGINKKLAARDKLKRLLDELHLNISEEALDMLIEGAVFLMNTEILGKVERYLKSGV